MILETYTQVNTNFFYSRNDINFEEFNTLNSAKINPKKLTQSKFEKLIEYFVFTEGFITKVETNNGTFVFYGITHDFDVKHLKEHMKKHSLNQELYYFNCVDYFSYAFFCVANNGKVERLIRYNSEAMGDEQEVYLAGKPHAWEKTFSGGSFTKQKLENCEQDFGYYELGLMVKFYLPFVQTDENKILNITVYSNKEHLKEIADCLVNAKPLKYYGEITTADETDIFKMLLKNDIKVTSTDIMLNKNYLLVYNYVMSATAQGLDISKMTIVSSKKFKKLNYFALNSETFYELFVNMVQDYKNAEQTNIVELSPLLQKLPSIDGHRLCQIMCEYNFVNKTYQVYFCTGRVFNAEMGEYLNLDKKLIKVGTKFDHKTSDKIFKYIKKYAKTYYDFNQKNQQNKT